MIHRINVFLLSLFVALTPNLIFLQAANATTVAGEGWSVTKRLVQGATTFYDGAKNVVLNGKNYAATGAAAITPTAAQVAKMIVRTGAVLAVDVAIKSLLGAVDYVMDPDNNRVKYYTAPTDYNDPSNQYIYQVQSHSNTSASTMSESCRLEKVEYQKLSDQYGWRTTYTGSYIKTGTGSPAFYCYLQSTFDGVVQSDTELQGQRYQNPAYNLDAPKTGEKYLPYDQVAAQVVSNAMAENSDAKAYVSSVADTALEDEQRQIVPATDITQQLNNSQAIPTSNTAQGQAVPQANPNDPTAPKAPPTDITINFPVFCDWAPSVCQAANAAINFPKLFVEKFQKWDDWLNRETKPYTADETKIDTEDKRTFDFSIFNANRFSVNPQCPMPEPTPLNVLGVQTVFSFDLKPICSILEMAKPALIACSYLYAAYIVIGASRG